MSMQFILLAAATAATPVHDVPPTPPAEPVTLTLPGCPRETPEIIPPFGNSPAAHAQACAASRIVLETAREAAAEAEESETEDGAGPETPSSSSG